MLVSFSILLDRKLSFNYICFCVICIIWRINIALALLQHFTEHHFTKLDLVIRQLGLVISGQFGQ